VSLNLQRILSLCLLLVRSLHAVQAPEIFAMATKPSTVPIVDFGKFLNGTQDDKREVARQIDDAFQQMGFVYLKNHTVPKEKVAECFQWV
jgi:hypothetical protein